jgi:Immunoglobulin-like domain of bacterial spore germination/Sporulation and spore germination
MRTSRHNVIPAILAAGLLAASCGQERAVGVGPVRTSARPTLLTTSPATPSSTPRSSPSETASPTPVHMSPSPAGTVTYQVWFTRGTRLFPVKRTQTATRAVGTAALQALLSGPADQETASGVGTQVPPGVRLLGLSISNGVATVNLSGRFLSGGSAVSEFTRLGEVVLTIDQFASVSRVSLQLEGALVKPFSIDGRALHRPWASTDFELLLPAIVVARPLAGERVTSPVTISGKADVFEATVSLRILDADGRELASGFTTATCGTGCRGTFSGQLKFSVEAPQPGVVEAFEASAKDGRPTNVVRIPVTLTP